MGFSTPGWDPVASLPSEEAGLLSILQEVEEHNNRHAAHDLYWQSGIASNPI